MSLTTGEWRAPNPDELDALFYAMLSHVEFLHPEDSLTEFDRSVIAAELRKSGSVKVVTTPGKTFAWVENKRLEIKRGFYFNEITYPDGSCELEAYSGVITPKPI